MLPVIFTFRKIMNFSPQLASSVVIIKTYYDNQILDDSGSDETNRKAVTGLSNSVLTTLSFSCTPKTEGETASYSVTVKPKVNIPSTGTLIFEFPA